MNFKIILIISFFFLLVQSCKTKDSLNSTSYKFDTKYQVKIKEHLGYAFGTIVNLEGKIIDGDNLNWKAAQGRYLFKVNSVNEAKLDTQIVMFFEDQSGVLSTDSAKHSLLNKTVSLIGYETGRFSGIPNGYDNYKMMYSGTFYGFHHYLIILSKP